MSRTKATTKRRTRRSTTIKTADSARPLTKSQALEHVKREPLGHLMAEQQLREAGFRGGVANDQATLTEYATDESVFSITPQIVLQPLDNTDVETAVRVLSEATKEFPSLSLTPRAAGTGLSGGSLTDSVVMDITIHLTAISEVREAGKHISISCQPGAMWRDVEARLKQHDAYLPPFPASKDICSIGGAVANNAAGPNSLRYGHVADWVESLEVVLSDGNSYDVHPLTYKEFAHLIKQKNNELAHIAKEVFALIEKNERVIKLAEPKTKKNSSGYALWDVLDTSVKEFKAGDGTFDLTKLFCGSQGTLGIITSITLRATKIEHNTTLLVVPVFDLVDASNVVTEALKYDPINLEVFDALSYDLALGHPEFFKDRLSPAAYYKVMFALYTTYHVRYRRKTPEFTMLITVDTDDMGLIREMLGAIRKNGGKKARLVVNESEKEMFWQVRRASYSLSKLQDPNKRPAAFLEDMTVPPKHLGKFFTEIKRLLKQYHLTAAVHGHGGNGHFHFYPLLDFTEKSTPKLIEKLSEEFFTVARKYEGNICGEHNDGIIRTPHLSLMYSKNALKLFSETEHIFDPNDIFNPGKKVNPRFDIRSVIRTTNN